MLNMAIGVLTGNRTRSKSMAAQSLNTALKKWWKSVLYLVGVLATIIAIGTPAYLIESRLNEFVSKEDVADVVHAPEMLQIQNSIKDIHDAIIHQDDKLQQVNDNVLKIYEKLLDMKLEATAPKPIKKKVPAFTIGSGNND